MWKLSIDDRLAYWKKFRQNLNSLSLDEALKETAELWTTSPCSPYYLDLDNPKNWPNPWELLTENHYCDIARCLGIVYTIYFTNHCKNIDLEIRIYQDIDACRLYSLVWVNQGKYILNWSTEEIVNTNTIEEKQLQLLYQYSSTDLVLEKY